MLMLVGKSGEENYTYFKVSVPIISTYTVRLRNDMMKVSSKFLNNKYNHLVLLLVHL